MKPPSPQQLTAARSSLLPELPKWGLLLGAIGGASNAAIRSKFKIAVKKKNKEVWRIFCWCGWVKMNVVFEGASLGAASGYS